jgi:hypothetical protein
MAAPFNVSSPTPDVAAATQVKVAGNQLFQMMLRSYQSNYNLVWANPNATPDTIVAAMGTDAVKLFALSAALAQLLTSAGAAGIPLTMPAGWTFAPNADGSATLTTQ